MTAGSRRATWAIVGVVLLVGVAIRVPFVGTNDSWISDLRILTGWVSLLASLGPIELMAQSGDITLYPPLSLLALWAGGLAGREVFVIKAIGIVGDIGLAMLVAWMLRDRSPKLIIAATAAVAFNPALWYLSASWGQIDTVYVLFLIGSLTLLAAGQTLSGWTAWAAAVLWKFQALTVGPVVALATLHRSGARGLVGGVAVCAVLAGVATLILLGPVPSAWPAYFGRLWQDEEGLNVSAFNVWHIVRAFIIRAGGPWSDILVGGAGSLIGIIGLASVVALAAIAMRRNPERVGLALPAATLTMATFVLMTAMRERYMLAALPLFLLVGVGWETGRIDRVGLLAFLAVTFTQAVNLIAVATFAPDLWINIFVTLPQGPLGFPMKALGYLCAAINIAVLAWGITRLWRVAKSAPPAPGG